MVEVQNLQRIGDAGDAVQSGAAVPRQLIGAVGHATIANVTALSPAALGIAIVGITPRHNLACGIARSPTDVGADNASAIGSVAACCCCGGVLWLGVRGGEEVSVSPAWQATLAAPSS